MAGSSDGLVVMCIESPPSISLTQSSVFHCAWPSRVKVSNSPFGGRNGSLSTPGQRVTGSGLAIDLARSALSSSHKEDEEAVAAPSSPARPLLTWRYWRHELRLARDGHFSRQSIFQPGDGHDQARMGRILRDESLQGTDLGGQIGLLNLFGGPDRPDQFIF